MPNVDILKFKNIIILVRLCEKWKIIFTDYMCCMKKLIMGKKYALGTKAVATL